MTGVDLLSLILVTPLTGCGYQKSGWKFAIHSAVVLKPPKV
jgi:hypothetical protein